MQHSESQTFRSIPLPVKKKPGPPPTTRNKLPMNTRRILLLASTAAFALPHAARAQLSVVHSFNSSTEVNPAGGLVLIGSKFYFFGGGSNTYNFGGGVYSMNTNGTGYSLVHQFAGGTGDGASPVGTLTLVGTKLYGVTSDGGTGNLGTFFSMNTDGTGYAVLDNFLGGAASGAKPFGDLVLSADGLTAYGETRNGGATNGGTLFAMTLPVTPVPEPATAGIGVALLSTVLLRCRPARDRRDGSKS